MANGIAATVNNWLHLLHIQASRRYICEQLQSHPDYPSLLSITDTLDELRVVNAAMQIEKEQLPDIPVPFLAHLQNNGGGFLVVKNRNNPDRQYAGFFEHWNGVVVVAEKPQNRKHTSNEEYLKKEKTTRQKISVFTGFIIALSVTSVFLNFNWIYTALLSVAIAGIFISWLIVSKELGIENKAADRVCGKEINCNSVIQSKAAKLPSGIGWSDIGLVWFTTLFLILLFSSFAGNTPGVLNVLSPMTFTAIPFTGFSIYYQWLVVKKWCPLCLITVALLWIQFFVLFPAMINKFWNALTVYNFLFIAVPSLIVNGIWLWIKSLLLQNKKLEEEKYAGKRFKYNADLFKALLEKQRQVDIMPWQGDLQLGNVHAALQIMIACSPYCGPCAKAHQVFHDLMEKNDIGLTVRFTVKTDNKKDEKTQAVEYILKKIAENNNDSIEHKRKILHDWFALMNFEKFKVLYPLTSNKDVSALLQLQSDWTDKSNIEFTPTFFINGHEIPKQYDINDLVALLKRLMVENNQNENLISETENNYAGV